MKPSFNKDQNVSNDRCEDPNRLTSAHIKLVGWAGHASAGVVSCRGVQNVMACLLYTSPSPRD